MILLHVGLAHVLRQAGAGRLLAREIVRCLFAVSQRKRRVQVKIRRLFHHPDQFGYRNLRQHLPGARCQPHVTAQQTGVGLADFRQRLSGEEMLHVIGFETGVGLAPS